MTHNHAGVGIGTTIFSGTPNRLLKTDANGLLDSAEPLQSYDTVSNDNSQNFLRVGGTLPTTATQYVAGMAVDLTSAGTNYGQAALDVRIEPGSTSSAAKFAISASNYVTSGSHNYGLFGDVGGLATGGTNVAAGGQAYYGDVNYGGNFSAYADSAKSATKIIGVLGYTANFTTPTSQIGGLFMLEPASVAILAPSDSAALIADNCATTHPIARFQNNGVDQVVINDTVNDAGTENFLRVVGTLPSGSSASLTGVRLNITSAGSTAADQSALGVYLGAGYTGSGAAYALYSEAITQSTNATYGNLGAMHFAYNTTTGTNRGVHAEAYNGNLNVAGSFISDDTVKANSVHIGVEGFARNTGASGKQIGGYFGLQSGINTPPTFASAALVADNGTTTDPIARFRNNGVDQVVIGDGVPDDDSQNLLKVVGTLPSSPSTGVQGVYYNITSAGSAAQQQYAQEIDFFAGYTGSSSTLALYLFSNVAGTNSSFGGGNIGSEADVLGTTVGNNIGFYGFVGNGNLNVGIQGNATTTKNSATNIGVRGFGLNNGTTPVQIGGYFGLRSTAPTFTSAALIADNGSQTDPIIRAQDNGTDVWTIQDGGSIQGKMASKTLTESTPTAFVRIACAQGAGVSGQIKYAVEASDATNGQIRSGVLQFAIWNKAGTETAAFSTQGTSNEAFIETAGASTLSAAFTATAGTDTMDINCNATSSLTQTTLRISYTVEIWSNAVVAVTPL